MWQHCNKTNRREYKTELDVDGINQLIDKLNHDNDVLRDYVDKRLCALLVGGGKMLRVYCTGDSNTENTYF
jgi:hypothetical protein